MIGVLLAFVSSVMWGGSDFAAGVASRRADVLRVTTVAYLAAGAVSMVVVVIVPGVWSPEAVWSGVVAGTVSIIGFLAFYLSLVRTAMGVATAILAASEAVVPVLVAVAWQGQSLSLSAWVGVGIAVVGATVVGLAEGGQPARATWWSAGLAAVAGVCFGVAVVALDAAPTDSGMIAPGLEMLLGVVVMPLLVLLVRSSRRAGRLAAASGLVESTPWQHRSTVLALGAGALIAGANVVLMFALRIGPLAAVGVVVSLYPVTTILLARVLLAERLNRWQVAGIVAALTGCVLLGIG